VALPELLELPDRRRSIDPGAPCDLPGWCDPVVLPELLELPDRLRSLDLGASCDLPDWCDLVALELLELLELPERRRSVDRGVPCWSSSRLVSPLRLRFVVFFRPCPCALSWSPSVAASVPLRAFVFCPLRSCGPAPC